MSVYQVHAQRPGKPEEYVGFPGMELRPFVSHYVDAGNQA